MIREIAFQRKLVGGLLVKAMTIGPHARDGPLPEPRGGPSRRGALPTQRAPRPDNGWDSSSAMVQPFLLKKAADTMSAAYQSRVERRSNPRPLPCDGSALPTELRPQDKSIFYLRLANCQRPITSLFGARHPTTIRSMIFNPVPEKSSANFTLVRTPVVSNAGVSSRLPRRPLAKTSS